MQFAIMMCDGLMFQIDPGNSCQKWWHWLDGIKDVGSKRAAERAGHEGLKKTRVVGYHSRNNDVMDESCSLEACDSVVEAASVYG